MITELEKYNFKKFYYNIKIVILIIFIFIPIIVNGSPAGQQATYEATNSNNNAKGSQSNGDSFGDTKSMKEAITNIKDALNIQFVNNSLDFHKGEPIDLRIRCTCSDDRFRIESLSTVAQMPPEIKLIEEYPKAENISNKIRWEFKNIYENSIELRLIISGLNGGNFQIPVTIKSKIRLDDGKHLGGEIPVDPISIKVYNHDPEIPLIYYPTRIIFPVIFDRSVHVFPRDSDNDTIECRLIGENEKFSSISVVPKINNTYEEVFWVLPFHLIGTYNYTVIVDDGEERDHSKQGDYPRGEEFKVIYGLSNFLFLLTLIPIIYLVIQYKRYKSREEERKARETERKRSILAMEMDEVINPLYLLFKKYPNITTYMAMPPESQLKHPDYGKLKDIESKVMEIFETRESAMDTELLHLIRQYQDLYSLSNFGRSEVYLERIFQYVYNRYEVLKIEIYKR